MRDLNCDKVYREEGEGSLRGKEVRARSKDSVKKQKSTLFQDVQRGERKESGCLSNRRKGRFGEFFVGGDKRRRLLARFGRSRGGISEEKGKGGSLKESLISNRKGVERKKKQNPRGFVCAACPL